MSDESDNTPEPMVIRGTWRQRPVRSYHAAVQRYALTLARHLDRWQRTVSGSDFEVVNHGWFQLHSFPPTFVCFPLAVFRGSIPTLETDWVPGVPLVAVDVFFGPDTFGSLWERVEEYLRCGVSLVFVLTPTDKTVTVHRPGRDVVALNSSDTLTSDPELPGFSCPVADLFR